MGKKIGNALLGAVYEELFNTWLEVVQLVLTVQLTDDEDALIWQFSTSGTYSLQSLYKIINFIEVLKLYICRLYGRLRSHLGYISLVNFE